MTVSNWRCVARLLSLAVISMTVACAGKPPTITGESDARARQSIERIVESLPINERAQFEWAVKGVALKGALASEADAMVMGGPFTREMLARLDGKTADQIFTESGVPRTAPVR